MMLAFALLITVSLGGMWLLFRVLIDDFSFRKMVTEIEGCYDELNSIMEGKTAVNREEREAIAVRIGQQYMVFLYNAKPQVNYSTNADSWYMEPIMRYTGYSSKNTVTKLVTDTNYTVYKNIDDSTQLMSIDLYGTLDNGFTVLVRASYVQMESDNRYITDRLLIVGLVVLLISILIALLISRAVTKPIRQMSEVAERMVGAVHGARKRRDRRSGRLAQPVVRAAAGDDRRAEEREQRAPARPRSPHAARRDAVGFHRERVA